MTTQDGLGGYREFLVATDGEPDLRRHTLSRREEFFRALEAAPVGAAAPVDAARFRRNVVRRRPERGLDDRLLWLLASAKANQAEQFAVAIAEAYGRIPEADADPIRIRMHLQETYHTRILADVVALFGLTFPLRPPDLLTRTFVAWLVTLPERWTHPFAGMSEMVGCVLFRALRERGVELFADEPAVAERIRLLYGEILADEIGHVGFIAATLGRRGRWLMRTLFRLFGCRLGGRMPEVVALFGHDELRRRFRDFRLEEMVGELPGRAHAAALI